MLYAIDCSVYSTYMYMYIGQDTYLYKYYSYTCIYMYSTLQTHFAVQLKLQHINNYIDGSTLNYYAYLLNATLL